MSKHTVEPEELQAWLDRELDSARQAEIERHLGECRECQLVLGDLKRVSQMLQRWQVEPAPASLRPPAVEDAEPQRRFSWRRLTWALAGTGVVALLLFSVALPELLRSRKHALPAPPPVAQQESPEDAFASRPPSPPASAPAEADRQESARRRGSLEKNEEAAAGEAGEVAGGTLGIEGRAADEAAPLGVGTAANRAPALKSAAATPRLIAYHVEMTVEVKQFDPAKEKLLQAVAEAGGYVAQANSAETPNQPQRAYLVVRVPAPKLAALLEQVRALGRVVNEQLSTDEVTEQVVDLEARLRNARATEQRLIAVLNERTGKVRDILEVEREIARTRGDIERMDAQRQSLRHRVELATVNVALVEEFKAQLAPAPVGSATRLHNAFVQGYDNFVGMLVGFVLFFARNGLVLFLWLFLLWLAWRALRRPFWRLVSTTGLRG